jgi:hypothetical protein
MTTLDERERAFEAMFEHDEEIRFRVEARRARLLAAWACERMGLFLAPRRTIMRKAS